MQQAPNFFKAGKYLNKYTDFNQLTTVGKYNSQDSAQDQFTNTPIGLVYTVLDVFVFERGTTVRVWQMLFAYNAAILSIYFRCMCGVSEWANWYKISASDNI